MKTLTKQNIIDIIYGCAVLGTGGGGSIAEGLEVMEDDLKENQEIQLISLDELPDDCLVATPYCCGAPIIDGAEVSDAYKALPQIEEPMALVAFRKLEEYFGKPFYAVSSTELGAANTADALHVACRLGLPIIDADPVGRSVPELQHSTYFVNDVPIAPMAVATAFGDAMVITEVVDDFRAEQITRAIAVASNNLVGVADHPTTGEVMKRSVIPNAISDAMRIGEILRTHKEDSAEKIAEEMSGKVLFKGVVTEMPWECVGGFNVGSIILKGVDEDKDEVYRLWFKNEIIVSYRNEVVDVSAPDLICMIAKNGTPLTMPNFEIGQEMTVLALPAPAIWQTEKGIACLGPKSFGFDFDYKPFSR